MKAVLIFLAKFFFYITVAGGIIFLLIYISYINTDKIFKKAFSYRGWEVINIMHTNRTFPVTPKRKWWSKYIRGNYGGSTEIINYRIVTFNRSGKQETMLAAVYRAPFVKPQLFLETGV